VNLIVAASDRQQRFEKLPSSALERMLLVMQALLAASDLIASDTAVALLQYTSYYTYYAQYPEHCIAV
jgi:hypothetical protein